MKKMIVAAVLAVLVIGGLGAGWYFDNQAKATEIELLEGRVRRLRNDSYRRGAELTRWHESATTIHGLWVQSRGGDQRMPLVPVSVEAGHEMLTMNELARAEATILGPKMTLPEIIQQICVK
jgi:hypothetical protein